MGDQLGYASRHATIEDPTSAPDAGVIQYGFTGDYTAASAAGAADAARRR